jgi:hypothetical protein
MDCPDGAIARCVDGKHHGIDDLTAGQLAGCSAFPGSVRGRKGEGTAQAAGGPGNDDTARRRHQ